MEQVIDGITGVKGHKSEIILTDNGKYKLVVKTEQDKEIPAYFRFYSGTEMHTSIYDNLEIKDKTYCRDTLAIPI